MNGTEGQDRESYSDNQDRESYKPECKLTGTDGNVFSIIGRVSAVLKKAGQKEQAAEFCKRAMSAGSYDEVLGMCFEYVDVL